MQAPLRYTILALLIVGLGACASTAELPAPRSIIVPTGVRVQAEAEGMEEVDVWVRRQMENINQDPTFLIITEPQDTRSYLWETLAVSGDTARIGFQRGASDAQTPSLIYAHFHLMSEREDGLEPWLPEAAQAEGYELERAILERVADVWLYGRAIFDAAPYGPLDELLYAREFGYLDALLLTLRSQEFPSAASRWRAEEPGQEERFRQWFRETFERDVDDPHPTPLAVPDLEGR
ncbi:MAG: hypothetical protein WEA09_14205 [Gemmatimonadota bacterium]